MASRNATFYDSGLSGALVAPLRRVLYVSMLFLALLFAAWTVDWLFVFKVWPDGLGRLQAILSEDLARTALLGDQNYDFPRSVRSTANAVYEAVFGITGVHDMGSRFASKGELSIPDTIVRDTYVANFRAIQVAMLGTQLFGVRLAILLAFWPLLMVVYLASMTDGLTQRAIRCASGGHESANIYHRAKYFQVALMASVCALCLLLPISIDFRCILLPGALLSAVFGRYQWTYYKKHL
ncbi:MAG: hypothetical protein JWR21_98 [Herminiimonas sp.]|nr:hypothetical protein [Herminiimonas sp.]